MGRVIVNLVDARGTADRVLLQASRHDILVAVLLINLFGCGVCTVGSQGSRELRGHSMLMLLLLLVVLLPMSGGHTLGTHFLQVDERKQIGRLLADLILDFPRSGLDQLLLHLHSVGCLRLFLIHHLLVIIVDPQFDYLFSSLHREFANTLGMRLRMVVRCRHFRSLAVFV